MIAVERGPSPSSLDSARTVRERERALEFFGDPANRGRSFNFRAYRALDVVRALRDLFNEKCAYCETFVEAGGPLTVEHYRPKGEASGGDGSVHWPGYYWLAASWDNLLPCCWYCNSKRGHDYPGGRRVTGKAIQFPLLDESRRADAPGKEDDEEPLLLDPCRDDPAEHLEFLTDDGAVRPTLEAGVPSVRGETTIEILGLHRPGLVKARMTAFRAIKTAIERFEEAVEALDEDPEDQQRIRRFARERDELKQLIHPRTPYAGMARQHIQPVLASLGLPLDQ